MNQALLYRYQLFNIVVNVAGVTILDFNVQRGIILDCMEQCELWNDDQKAEAMERIESLISSDIHEDDKVEHAIAWTAICATADPASTLQFLNRNSIIIDF